MSFTFGNVFNAFLGGYLAAFAFVFFVQKDTKAMYWSLFGSLFVLFVGVFLRILLS